MITAVSLFSAILYTTTSAAIVGIGQYHSQNELHDYTFGYYGGPSSKHETKVDKVTKGKYSYVDPNGKLQHVEYTSDENGFKIDAATNLPKMGHEIIPEKPKTKYYYNPFYPQYYPSLVLTPPHPQSPQFIYYPQPVVKQSRHPESQVLPDVIDSHIRKRRGIVSSYAPTKSLKHSSISVDSTYVPVSYGVVPKTYDEYGYADKETYVPLENTYVEEETPSGPTYVVPQPPSPPVYNYIPQPKAAENPYIPSTPETPLYKNEPTSYVGGVYRNLVPAPVNKPIYEEPQEEPKLESVKPQPRLFVPFLSSPASKIVSTTSPPSYDRYRSTATPPPPPSPTLYYSTPTPSPVSTYPIPSSTPLVHVSPSSSHAGPETSAHPESEVYIRPVINYNSPSQLTHNYIDLEEPLQHPQDKQKYFPKIVDTIKEIVHELESIPYPHAEPVEQTLLHHVRGPHHIQVTSEHTPIHVTGAPVHHVTGAPEQHVTRASEYHPIHVTSEHTPIHVTGAPVHHVTREPEHHPIHVTTEHTPIHVTGAPVHHVTGAPVHHVTGAPDHHVTGAPVHPPIHVTSEHTPIHVTGAPVHHPIHVTSEHTPIHVTGASIHHVTREPEHHVTREPEHHPIHVTSEHTPIHVTGAPVHHVTGAPEHHVTGAPVHHVTREPEHHPVHVTTVVPIVHHSPTPKIEVPVIVQEHPVEIVVPVVKTPVKMQFHSQDELGQYTYGYSNEHSAKHEVKTADGITKGEYSYVDANGEVQVVKYISDDHNGFRVAASNLPVGPVPAAPEHGPEHHEHVPDEHDY